MRTETISCEYEKPLHIFLLRISSVNVTKCEEILNGNLHFLYSEILIKTGERYLI